MPQQLLGFATLELRQATPSDGGAADTIVVHGVACRTEVEYEVYGGPPWGWMEVVASDAFAATLAAGPDVVLVANHEGLPLARTISSTLTLAQTDTGLEISATLDPANPLVSQIASGIERGDITEMSFAFRIVSQQWSPDWATRRILEVDIDRGDVSIVTFGANEHTEVEMAAHAQRDALRDAAAAVDADAVAAQLARTQGEMSDQIARRDLARAYSRG